MVKTSTLAVILGVMVLSVIVFANEADGAGLVWRAVSKVGSLISDLADVGASGCSNGEVLKYQTSNSTWICGTDATGSGIASINGDTTAAQTIVGVTGNTTASTTSGATTINLGTNVVTTGGSAQTITKGLTINSGTLGGTLNANGNILDNAVNINDNSGAEAGSGVLRVGNTVDAVCWEASPAGADICLNVNSLEDFIFDSDINVIDLDANPVNMTEQTAPSTPATNEIVLYAKDMNGASQLFTMNDVGREIQVGSVPLPQFKKWGAFYPSGASATVGGQMGLLASSVTDGTETIGIDTDGARTATPGTGAAGTDAGFQTTNVIFQRGFDIYMIAKVQYNATSGPRQFIGFISSGTLPNNDAVCGTGSLSCAGFVADSNDATWSIITNAADATESRTNSFTRDTAVHLYEVWSESSNNRFGFRFDGGETTYVSADIPLATTSLVLDVEAETATSTPSIEIYFIYAESMR